MHSTLPPAWKLRLTTQLLLLPFSWLLLLLVLLLVLLLQLHMLIMPSEVAATSCKGLQRIGDV